ncbi:MAG: hydrogenase 3 maturation endopeptidase HyCI [Planctomycetota bacterium]
MGHLNKLHSPGTLILTIGNILKGDDAIGPLIYQQLKNELRAEIIDAGTVPENYIQTIVKKAPEALLIIDAIDFSASAGTIRLFKPDQLNSIIISTHSLSPRVFVDMITNEIDVQVYFLGIQPLQVQIGSPLSAEVDRAAKKIMSILTGIFGPASNREDAASTPYYSAPD